MFGVLVSAVWLISERYYLRSSAIIYYPIVCIVCSCVDIYVHTHCPGSDTRDGLLCPN